MFKKVSSTALLSIIQVVSFNLAISQDVKIEAVELKVQRHEDYIFDKFESFRLGYEGYSEIKFTETHKGYELAFYKTADKSQKSKELLFNSKDKYKINSAWSLSQAFKDSINENRRLPYLFRYKENGRIENILFLNTLEADFKKRIDDLKKSGSTFSDKHVFLLTSALEKINEIRPKVTKTTEVTVDSADHKILFLNLPEPQQTGGEIIYFQLNKSIFDALGS
jgi:hypothetical protein